MAAQLGPARQWDVNAAQLSKAQFTLVCSACPACVVASAAALSYCCPLCYSTCNCNDKRMSQKQGSGGTAAANASSARACAGGRCV